MLLWYILASECSYIFHWRDLFGRLFCEGTIYGSHKKLCYLNKFLYDCKENMKYVWDDKLCVYDSFDDEKINGIEILKDLGEIFKK